MMGMMKELFKRNKMQMRLLSLLSQRVEQLEKAFVCDKLMRTKRKKDAGSVVDCSESTLDMKKCGKKR
uniref:Uncharacterized protein n=1 Tax=Rhizophora mucronata TaxID=61149 RepID=A0A2P2PKV2_RHIMU